MVIKSIAIPLLLAIVAAGCASKPTLQSWQRGIEKYVAERKDPNALRDVTVLGSRRGFAVIGGADPQKSTDVNGLLLGHNTIDGQPWFIYLVGLVHQQRVSEIHLAAVTFAGNHPRWAMSAKNPQALSLYRQYNERLFHDMHGPNAKPPGSFTTFPREGDSFELTGSDSTIQATHPPSGAKWTLDVKHAHAPR
jgi:hypothetical protein